MTRSISNAAMTFLYFLIGAEIKELKSNVFSFTIYILKLLEKQYTQYGCTIK